MVHDCRLAGILFFVLSLILGTKVAVAAAGHAHFQAAQKFVERAQVLSRKRAGRRALMTLLFCIAMAFFSQDDCFADFVVQVGAFQSPALASERIVLLNRLGLPSMSEQISRSAKPDLTTVLVGPFEKASEAQSAQAFLEKKGVDGFVRSHRANPNRVQVANALSQEVTPMIAAGVDAKVLVKEIKITGAEAIQAAELQPIVAPYVGKEMGLSDLRKVADAITEEYRRRGYNLARAIVPEQDLSTGTVEIRVLEARIGKLTIEGNTYFSNSLIERAFTGVMGDKAVKQSSVEETLLRLRDQYPDLKATAGLKAGAEPGTTDIVVSAPDTLPVHLAIDYRNYGVPTVSRHILGVELNVVDPWIGSHFSFREETGFDPTLTNSRRASYTLPINNYGTRFGGYFANGDFAVGGDLSALNIRGKSEGWGLSFTHPFMQTRFHKLQGEFGFDLRDSKLFNDLGADNLDRIRLLKAGMNYEGLDSTGLTFASVYLFQGLGRTFGGSSNDNPRASRLGAGDNFTYGVLNLLRFQSITNYLRGIARMVGQVSSAPLVASEQFGLGGPDTVRGYQYREIIGDNVFNVGTELRVLPIPDNEILQLSLGFDYGFVQQRKPAPGERKFQGLMGYGPGVRLNVPFDIASRTNYFSVRFDVGFPISPSKNSENTRPVYYVLTSLRF